MKFKSFRLALAATLGVAALSACSADDTENEVASGATIQEVYEAAKKESELVIYGPGEALMQPVYDAFQKAYPGVKVSTVTIFGAELDARLQAEQAGGGESGDLIHISEADMLRYEKQAVLKGLQPVDASKFSADIVDEATGWVVPQKTAFGLIHNTAKVKEADLPKTWAEVVDPSRAGTLSISDFTTAASCAAGLTSAYAKGVIDGAWLDDLKSLKPMVFPGTVDATNAVVTGEADVQLCANFSVYQGAKAKGAPVGFSYLDDGVYLEPFPYAQIKGSDSSNAARLLMSWILTDKGQDAIATIGGVPVLESDLIAPELVDIASRPQLEFPGLEEYAKTIEVFSDKF